MLAGADSAADLCTLFGDRSTPVAKTSGTGGDGYTLWAVVAKHEVPPRVLAAAGPPGDAPWRPFDVFHHPYDRGEAT